MPKRKQKTKKGKKYQKPLSLYPLTPEQSIQIAVNTLLPEKYQKKKRGKKASR